MSMWLLQSVLYCVLLSTCPGAKEQWSVEIVVKYEYGANEIFWDIRDGTPLTEFDPYLIERRANTEAEPNFAQLTYQDMYYDILNDAPYLNMVNLTDGRRDHRQLPGNFSPRLLGMSRDGSILYVICIEMGNCHSHHELQVMLFSTLKCEPGKGAWCKDPAGPFTLATDVPCSEKLPRMAIMPIDTSAMILLDSAPMSAFLNCIFVDRNQPQCNLDGVLPENRLEIRYFFNTSSQETLMQIQLMKSHNFSQYVINQEGLIWPLHFSNSAEQNLPCPMLSPNVFNCTAGMQFMNGTKLFHLSGAVGEPQSFQLNGASGVAYVRQRRGESAVEVWHTSLSGGMQVLDNSTWVCRDDALVKPVYVLKGGTVFAVAQCFPNGESVLQVYLYQEEKAHYDLVLSRQPLQLRSAQFGKVLNILLIGEPFLVPNDTVPSTSVLPPDGQSVATPTFFTIVMICGAVGLVLLASVIVTVVYCICRRKEHVYRRMRCIRPRGNDAEDKGNLLDVESDGDDEPHDTAPGRSSPHPGGDQLIDAVLQGTV